jgi:Holliday junction resolvase
MNSRSKGKRGELEWRDVIRSRGYEARRGQQFSGSPDSPDVVTNLPFHFEVKRVEKFSIYKAMQQAKDECGSNPPIVAHRKNGGEWLVIMQGSTFFNIIEEQCQQNKTVAKNTSVLPSQERS